MSEPTIQDIVSDPVISKAEKIKRLEKMRFDAEALERATGEGMEPKTEAAASQQTDLRAIELAIEALEQDGAA
jgi:hypothetical protein